MQFLRIFKSVRNRVAGECIIIGSDHECPSGNWMPRDHASVSLFHNGYALNVEMNQYTRSKMNVIINVVSAHKQSQH